MVRLNIDTKNGASSIRISFTDQRLTAHGGMVVWSHFLHQKRFREQLREELPHAPISPNAYDPTDVALGYIGGILCGADKLSRVAWLQSDPAIAQVLGIEAVASQSTLSRFFEVFTEKACTDLSGLHQTGLETLPPAIDCWIGSSQSDCQLLLTQWQHSLCHRGGGLSTPNSERTAQTHSSPPGARRCRFWRFQRARELRGDGIEIHFCGPPHPESPIGVPT